MIDGIKERFNNRMNGEKFDDTITDEIIQTVTDRLCLRLGVSEKDFPAEFHSIVVDASVKVWRRRYYEGIETEGVALNMSTTFSSDVLAEYQTEIDQWLKSAEAGGASGARKVVRFL